MNLLKNLYVFLRNLANHIKIDWNNNLCIKRECTINESTKIYGNHNLYRVNVGFGTAIGKNSNISEASIGKFCSIGPNFFCGWGIHPINGISINPAFYSTAGQNGFSYSTINKVAERKPILIGNDVFIGANVTVLDGVVIGDGAVIGAGAIVSKNIPPYAVAVGCPINIIKYRFSPEVIEELLTIQWWNKDERIFKKVEEHFYDVDSFLKELREPVINSQLQ